MNTIIYDFGIMHLLSFLFYELLTYYHDSLVPEFGYESLIDKSFYL